MEFDVWSLEFGIWSLEFWSCGVWEFGSWRVGKFVGIFDVGKMGWEVGKLGSWGLWVENLEFGVRSSEQGLENGL